MLCPCGCTLNRYLNNNSAFSTIPAHRIEMERPATGVFNYKTSGV